MSNDHGIRVHEDLTNHESQDVLAFVHGRDAASLMQSGEKALEALGRLQVGLFVGQQVVEGDDSEDGHRGLLLGKLVNKSGVECGVCRWGDVKPKLQRPDGIFSLNGEEQQYYPDFIVRLRYTDRDAIVNLILEVTGEKKKDKEAKVATARDLWVPAVNAHGGFGCRGFLEVTDPWNTQNTIRAALKAGVL